VSSGTSVAVVIAPRSRKTNLGRSLIDVMGDLFRVSLLRLFTKGGQFSKFGGSPVSVLCVQCVVSAHPVNSSIAMGNRI